VNFWAPVEPRYGEIVRVMFAKDEWIVPTVNGGIYTDKPVFFFWLALVASKIAGGVSEWTVRTAGCTRRYRVYLTTVLLQPGFFLCTDCPHCGGCLSNIDASDLGSTLGPCGSWSFAVVHVVGLFCRPNVSAQRSRLRILLAYAFMGLAVLTKGLIGRGLAGLGVYHRSCSCAATGACSARPTPLGIPILLLITSAVVFFS
jgi:hypothetical protein